MLQCRTEEFSGSKVRDIVKVFQYEIFELGNTDILETLKNSILKENVSELCLNKMIDELIENGYIDDMFEDEQFDYCKKLVNAINVKLNKNIQYALWLADMEVVEKIYKGVYLDFYETSNCILSNLGKDGILYGYEEMPKIIRVRRSSMYE